MEKNKLKLTLLIWGLQIAVFLINSYLIMVMSDWFMTNPFTYMQSAMLYFLFYTSFNLHESVRNYYDKFKKDPNFVSNFKLKSELKKEVQSYKDFKGWRSAIFLTYFLFVFVIFYIIHLI